jgi:hypothetical protein
MFGINLHNPNLDQFFTGTFGTISFLMAELVNHILRMKIRRRDAISIAFIVYLSIYYKQISIILN